MFPFGSKINLADGHLAKDGNPARFWAVFEQMAHSNKGIYEYNFYITA